MNIRLSDQQIRFRMTKTELTDLLAGKSIQTKTTFPDNTSLNFYVNIGLQKSPTVLKRDKDIIMLYIEERQAKELEKKIPTKKGISLVLGKEAEPLLKVVVEVDVFTHKL